MTAPPALRLGHMSTDQETVTADQPTTFPTTRADALAAWAAFKPRLPEYDAARNDLRPGHRAVSRLSPAIRHRLITEHELVADTLASYPFGRVEKFVQELLWRRYWKSWLELRPAVWDDYQAEVRTARAGLRGYQAKRVEEVEAGRSGVQIIDYFADELRTTGYLHNHARMWFAGYWIHVERLPWAVGADFFYRHLLDADPASNTLSWRWVAGIQTRGKPYVTTRSNLERYVEPGLLAAHAGGLEKLGGEAVVVEAPDPPRPRTPADADDVELPGALPDQVGLWVHGDDLGVETATPLDGLRPVAVFGGSGPAEDGISPARQAYLRATLADGLGRAARHFGVDPTESSDPLPDALAGWAEANGLRAVVGLRPAVGPVWDRVPAIRSRLAASGVALHLVWRPEDVRTLPWAEAGYFNFWKGAKAALTGERPAANGKRRR